MSIRNTRRAAIAAATAVAALAAVLDTGMFEHEWLKDRQGGTAVAGATRPFWPAAFDQVLAVGAVQANRGM